jgi:hypothetical protein
MEADAVKVFASVGSIEDIHDALRLRFDALEISRASIDAAAGLPDGYASKLLAPVPIKRFGDISLWPTLQVAGLRLALIEDPNTLAQTARITKRDRSQVRHQLAGIAPVEACGAATFSDLARKGGTARMSKLTVAARRRLGKLAARARWSKRRKSA